MFCITVLTGTEDNVRTLITWTQGLKETVGTPYLFTFSINSLIETLVVSSGVC